MQFRHFLLERCEKNNLKRPAIENLIKISLPDKMLFLTCRPDEKSLLSLELTTTTTTTTTTTMLLLLLCYCATTTMLLLLQLLVSNTVPKCTTRIKS